MEKTIFVVDDNGTNLSIADAMLEDQYSVITMSSAAKMFFLLGKIRPDLILLDIEMPEMNGYEAIGVLKADDKNKDIPVIFLTAMTDADIESKCLELGAEQIILKPFSQNDLLSIVGNHI